MKSTVFWGLIVLNLVLLAGLIAPYMRGNEAFAQRQGGRRPELMMIPGEVTGQSSQVIYLVDTANRRLGAVALSQDGKRLDAMSPQDLDRVFDERAAGGGPRAGTGNKKP
jgi:hypothetical protein